MFHIGPVHEYCLVDAISTFTNTKVVNKLEYSEKTTSCFKEINQSLTSRNINVRKSVGIIQNYIDKIK